MKLPFRAAKMRVDFSGLKHAPWRNCVSSIFVVSLWMITLSLTLMVGRILQRGRFWRSGVTSWLCWNRRVLHFNVDVVLEDGKVISHRPSSKFLNPSSKTFLFLQTYNFLLVNTMWQLSSHSWPKETKLVSQWSLRRYVFVTAAKNCRRGKFAVAVVVILELLGRVMAGPYYFIKCHKNWWRSSVLLLHYRL